MRKGLKDYNICSNEMLLYIDEIDEEMNIIVSLLNAEQKKAFDKITELEGVFS